MGLTMGERNTVTKEIAARHRRATKKQKGIILDEFTALTGYNRSYASYLLNSHGKEVRVNSGVVIKADVRKKANRQRQKFYDEKVKRVLRQIWEMMGCICGKRLAPIIKELIAKLKEFKELAIDIKTEQKFLTISPATIDRLLKEYRKMHELKGRSHTKPGTLLKSQIPIRTFSQWDEQRPGFLEIDLVGHEGGDPSGEFIQSLDSVDICAGWVELDAVRNKAQKWVFEAIDAMKNRLPFDLLGLDSDNGAEFINDHLYRYFLQNRITFTRARKYRKNDNCYVEQKNYSVVRKYVWYFRYDTQEELMIMKELYGYLRLYINFFLPVMKQISKTRIGSKVIKKYDKPKTPYQRILESPYVSKDKKDALKRLYGKLNPAEIHRQIQRLQNRLYETAMLKEEIKKAKPICHKKSKSCYAYI